MKKLTALILGLLMVVLTACSDTSSFINKEENATVVSAALTEIVLTTGDEERAEETASESEAIDTATSTKEEPIISEGETLTIQFVDVGQADAALVECGEKYLLIDGGNRADSNILYAILKRNNITHLDYVVGTHAHEDHIGGIAGALNACESVGTVFSPVTEYDSKTFANFVNAAREKGVELTVPNVGDEFTLGSAMVQILGPARDYDDTNNTSIVLKIVFGQTSFLFTGDMEHDAEIDLLDSGADVKADVLKVGHHGSDTSTSYRFLREVAPQYGIISVGEKNSYGHPHEEPLSRLRDAEVEVFRTDEVGDILCTSDGKTIVFETKKY